MRALTDFLLRESLALLLDDPTPRRVAQAMGGAYATEAAALESQQTEDASEDSESQGLAGVATTTHRVMMVRSTDSAHQRVSLVDRSFSIEAFIASHVVDELRRAHKYKSIVKLRGSVVRVEKYHFATPAQCRAKGAPQPSVSTRHARREGHSKLLLVVDALTVIDDSELAVNPMPSLEEHGAVAKQLNALAPAALDQRLALRQGLAVASTTTTTTSAVTERVTPSPAKRFGEDIPLQDIDCEIPEDQEHELDAQESWPDPEQQPTDSQLIAENGPVAGSGESQPITSSSSNTVVSSSSDAATPDRRIVVLETEPQTSSQSQSVGVAPSQGGHTQDDGSSVPDSQDFHFQQVNLKKAFVDCSDTDSDNEEYVLPGAASQREQPLPSTPSRRSSPRRASATPRSSQRSQRSATPSSQATESQSLPSQDEATESQQPLTQAPELSGSLSLADESSTPMPASQPEASQALGEFVGVVRADHDEPMTQIGDESQAAMSQEASSAGNVEWNTQAQDANPSLEIPSDPETVDVEYDMGQDEAPAASAQEQKEDEDEELEDRPPASQQDGQADHWMDTQPTDSSPAKNARRREVASPREVLSPSAIQRRKRRRTLVPSAESRVLSPQEPTTKAARTQREGSTTTTATVSAASSESVARGISAFSRKASGSSQLQRLRPSKRYEHLLPPFDLDAIRQLINDKKE